MPVPKLAEGKLDKVVNQHLINGIFECILIKCF